MNTSFATVVGFVRSDEKGKLLLERFLEPLFEASKDDLSNLIDTLYIAIARTVLPGNLNTPLTKGGHSRRILGDILKLVTSIKESR